MMFNVVVQFIVFLTSATLICRGTNISKCFRESLGIRDNVSRLYVTKKKKKKKKKKKIQVVSEEPELQTTVY